MNISIQQAASALQAYEQWHQTIADNMSAANVPGFKRSSFSLTANDTGVSNPIGSASTGDATIQNYLLPKGESHYDYSQGQLKHTGLATDIAIGEEGFFELELPDGSTAYTRDGEFRINDLGELVTKQGYQVMGTNGPVIFDDKTGLNFQIAPDGTISENGIDSGQKLVAKKIEDTTKLEASGEGNFLLKDQSIDIEEVESPNFQQRYIEQSNVSAIQEMTRMIQVMRSHEANHRVIQQHDQRIGKVINELGQPI